LKLSNEAKVGINVTVALVALFWGINHQKGVDLLKNINTYFAIIAMLK
jgi:hypothetical protein